MVYSGGEHPRLNPCETCPSPRSQIRRVKRCFPRDFHVPHAAWSPSGALIESCAYLNVKWALEKKMGHFRRTQLQICTRSPCARKDEGSGRQEENVRGGEQSHAGIQIQQRTWKWAFTFSCNTTTCSTLLRRTLGFSAYVMTGKKNDLLTSLLLLTLPPSLHGRGEERVNFNLAIPGERH